MTTSAPTDADPLAASTATLLASSGDTRHTILEHGRNKYGNRYEPEPGVVTFGSCTSSTVSDEAFDAASRLHGWLLSLDEEFLDRAIDDLYERVRAELTANVAMSLANHLDVVITPSGTDAELIPLLVMLEADRPLTNILVGASEAGSGTLRAAAGRHFDVLTPSGTEVVVGDPIDPVIADRVTTAVVRIRHPDGTPRDEDDIDAEVAALVRSSIDAGRSALVHVIAHSKTGVHAPSLATASELLRSGDGRVGVVIDAAQGRFSRRGLHESLSTGFMVMTTGSKFFGGPPFAGAVLLPRLADGAPPISRFPDGCSDYLTPEMLPRRWAAARQSLAPGHNLGVLLRWWAALAEIRDYYSVPAQLRFEVLQRFQRAVPEAVANHPQLTLRTIPPPLSADAAQRLLESKTTVFPFTCTRTDGSFFAADELREAQRLVRARLDADGPFADLPERVRHFRAELGQPVGITGDDPPISVLRLALGARQIIRTCVVSTTGRTFEERLAALARDVDLTFAKLDAVLAHLEARS